MADVAQRVQALWEECARPDVGAAWLLCDRHPADAVAITLVEEDLSSIDLTYGALRAASERAAAGLAELGVGPGDRVATLMGKGERLLETMLGTWRLGAVYVPLFTAFGPQAIAMRLTDTDAKVVVTDADQRPKLDPGPDMPADAPWQVVVDGALDELYASASRSTQPAYVGGGAHPFVHMLTSGTTGRPKGVVHPLSYVADWLAYHEFSLDLRPDDALLVRRRPGLGVRPLRRDRRAARDGDPQPRAARQLLGRAHPAPARRAQDHQLRGRADRVPRAALRGRAGRGGCGCAGPRAPASR